jgi:hypothetical protein
MNQPSLDPRADVVLVPHDDVTVRRLSEGFVKTLPAEDVFAGQVVQLSVPVVALNFPAEHAEHVPPSAMNPALH